MITAELLADLNKMSMLTGKLSELHIKNIQSFPFVFFDDVKSVDIEYNIDLNGQNDGSYIRYYLKTKNKRKKVIKHLDKRLDTLRKSISTLLWSGINVSVYLNGSDKELK